MSSRKIILTKPNKSSNNWDLRDVVPIISNCKLQPKHVYKIADAGIDLKTKKDEIIRLANEGESYLQIIEYLK
jgi:hypothetical protein